MTGTRVPCDSHRLCQAVSGALGLLPKEEEGLSHSLLSGSSLGTACGMAAKAEGKEQDVSALGVSRQVPDPKLDVSVPGTLFLLIDLLFSCTGQRAH